MFPLDNHDASYSYALSWTSEFGWRALALKQYGAAFHKNEIDDTVLLSMTVEELGFTTATTMKR